MKEKIVTKDGFNVQNQALITMWALIQDRAYDYNIGNYTHPTWVKNKPRDGFELA